MKQRKTGLTAMAFAAVLTGTSALHADVITSAPDHYTLRHKATSTLSADALWEKLVKPETWWHPDHTYSGDSKNLSLSLEAGGLWREDWAEGSVFHGSVLLVEKGKRLRLNAPFGPLQDIGITVVWTITITPSDTGSTVVFDEIANGTAASRLDKLAPAVNFVKDEAIKRLVGN